MCHLRAFVVNQVCRECASFWVCFVQTFNQTLRTLLRFCADICPKIGRWDLWFISRVTSDKTALGRKNAPVPLVKNMSCTCWPCRGMISDIIYNFYQIETLVILIGHYSLKLIQIVSKWVNWLKIGSKLIHWSKLGQICSSRESCYVAIAHFFGHYFVKEDIIHQILDILDVILGDGICLTSKSQGWPCICCALFRRMVRCFNHGQSILIIH